MKLDQKNWGCYKKYKAREETIIHFYNKYFYNFLPEDKQYWTISGQCATIRGKIIKNCELDHVLSVKLIKPEQFHSAEIEPNIHKVNSKILKSNWYNDDLYQAMVKLSNEGRNKFNPAIINYDALFMPERGTHYLAKILAFLTSLKIRDVMVVANFILRRRQYTSSNNETIELLDNLPNFKYAKNNAKWELYEKNYTYNGTGKNYTFMGSVILINKG